MRHRLIAAALLFAGACAVWGLRPPAAIADEQANCAAAKAIYVELASWEQTREHVMSFRGQVVLVNVWTTTCPTCREEFPEFVKLSDRLREQGLVCVSVNCDYDGVPSKPPEHYVPRVRDFLCRSDAQLRNVLLTDPLLDFLDETGIGSTPCYLLYRADGTLRQRFDGSIEEFTFADVIRAAESEISALGKIERSANSD